MIYYGIVDKIKDEHKSGDIVLQYEENKYGRKLIFDNRILNNNYLKRKYLEITQLFIAETIVGC